jgi:hypothetical protein
MPAAHTNMPGAISLHSDPPPGKPGAGHQPQAASVKPQAMQGSSCKLQAASFKQGWFESFINFQGASGKLQAPSSKHQAASHSR